MFFNSTELFNSFLISLDYVHLKQKKAMYKAEAWRRRIKYSYREKTLEKKDNIQTNLHLQWEW